MNMDGQRDLRHVARLAADLLVRYDWRVWYFADSVGCEGLLAATDLTGEEAYRHFVYGLAQGWAARSAPWQRYDYTAPGVALLDVARHFGDARLRARLLDWAEWQAHLTQAGGQVLLDPAYALWVWVDCMQFQGPFFAHLGRETGDARHDRQAERFLLAQAEALRDESGLFSHVYDVTTCAANGVHWARGQGWAMRGLWQTYRALPPDRPSRPRIAELLRAQLDALLPYQRESGHWRTIVDDPDAYEETSVAAFYVATATPALDAGLLDAARHAGPLERAWAAVLAAVDDTGWYRGVSADTPAGDAAHYKDDIARDRLVPWGQGPFLLALHAYLGRSPQRSG